MRFASCIGIPLRFINLNIILVFAKADEKNFFLGYMVPTEKVERVSYNIQIQ